MCERERSVLYGKMCFNKRENSEAFLRCSPKMLTGHCVRECVCVYHAKFKQCDALTAKSQCLGRPMLMRRQLEPKSPCGTRSGSVRKQAIERVSVCVCVR